MSEVGTSIRLHPSLPIFLLDVDGGRFLYAPGVSYQVNDATLAIVRPLLEGSNGEQATGFEQVTADLVAHARRALDKWRGLSTAPFAPECLTLYLSNECNLGCSYCYAAPVSDGNRRRRLPIADRAASGPTILDEAAIAAAAEVVAHHCKAKGRPFTLVLHGGGEPTLHWDLLQTVVALTRRQAGASAIGWQAYIATHGFYPTEKAQWLAKEIPWIGLSCDGPPELQDEQRPAAGGAGTSALLEASAAVFRTRARRFTVRATITPRTVRKQVEIVSYAADRLGAHDIRVEPVYGGRTPAGGGFTPEDAALFVEHFLAAEARARELGVSIALSGVRPDEVHGPFCHVLRDVLALTPDGSATGCFLSTDGRTPDDRPFVLGQPRGRASFAIDVEAVTRLRAHAVEIPTACTGCVNAYHCARDCPDRCPVTVRDGQTWQGGFRCGVQKRLSHSWIARAAKQIEEA